MKPCWGPSLLALLLLPAVLAVPNPDLVQPASHHLRTLSEKLGFVLEGNTTELDDRPLAGDEDVEEDAGDEAEESEADSEQESDETESAASETQLPSNGAEPGNETQSVEVQESKVTEVIVADPAGAKPDLQASATGYGGGGGGGYGGAIGGGGYGNVGGSHGGQ